MKMNIFFTPHVSIHNYAHLHKQEILKALVCQKMVKLIVDILIFVSWSKINNLSTQSIKKILLHQGIL